MTNRKVHRHKDDYQSVPYNLLVSLSVCHDLALRNILKSFCTQIDTDNTQPVGFPKDNFSFARDKAKAWNVTKKI